MTEFETLGEESIDARGPINYVGTDGDGADHYHAPYEGRVWVVQDGEIVHEEDLAGRPIDHWIDYVRSERGAWIECHYHDTFEEAFLAAISGFAAELREEAV